MKKVILITGCSSGIGLECADFLSKQGNVVYGTYNTNKPNNVEFNLLKLDLNCAGSIDHVLDHVIEKEYKIDCLINNAGYGLFSSVENCNINRIKQQFQVNLFSHVQLMQKTIELMSVQKYGLIINIGSLACDISLPFQGFYCATKSALQSITESLRMELKHSGIKICIIKPGDFKTSFTSNRIKAIESFNNKYYPYINNTLNNVNIDEHNGSDPIKVVKLANKIINKKNIRAHYITGNFFKELLFAKIKNFLPYPLIEYIIRKHYFNSRK